MYSYISLLRNSSSLELKEAQDEIIKLTQIFFRYREKSSSASNYVSRVAERAAHPYPRDQLLSGPAVVEDWDESLVRDLFTNYITPRRGRVMVMAREGWDTTPLIGEQAMIGTVTEWNKEKWYGTEYCVRKVPEGLLQQVKPHRSVGPYI